MKLPAPRYAVTDKNHRYTIEKPDGTTIGPLKSVTGILDIRSKPALIGWAAREAANYFKTEILRLGKAALTPDALELIAKDAAGAHRRKAKDAADLGQACHNAFENIILGKDPENPPKEIIEPINAFKNYRLQSDVEVVATELAVASEQYRVGGRLDFLGWSKSRGGYGIGDYKTASGWFGNDFAYQAGGGYALLTEETYGIKIKWAEVIRFSKKFPYESEAKPVLNIQSAMSGFLETLAMVRRDETSLFGEPLFQSAGISKKEEISPVGF